MWLEQISTFAGESCTNPTVRAHSYTPSDAQVLTHIAFIAEFTLECSNGAKNVNLYADVGGNLVPVIKSDNDPSKLLVSWTKELKAAVAGDHEVNLYDDEGFATIKRVMDRGGAEKHGVKPLATIVVQYPGAYKGPWVNSELIALGLAILVFSLAHSSKKALLA